MNYLVQEAYRLGSNNIKETKDLYQGLQSRTDGWPDDAAAFVDPKPLEAYKNVDRTPPDFLWASATPPSSPPGQRKCSVTWSARSTCR